MGLLGMLIREVITLASEFKSKKNLESKLGREVETRDIYSLGANLEAAQANNSPNQQFQFAAQPNAQVAQTFPPAAKPKNKLLIFGIIGGAVVLLLFFGVAFLVMISMTESTYNRLNPFTPKPPTGAFPAAIADYNLDHEYNYSSSYSDICKCNYFKAWYLKATGGVSYVFYQFKTEGDAKNHLAKRDFIGGVPRYEQVTDSRFVEIDKEKGSTIVALAAGTNLIVISGKNPAEVIAFENKLPYSSYGVSPPQERSADGLADDALQATNILQDFKRDKTVAKTKYDGKTLLLTGTVVVSSTDKKDAPYLAFQLPNTKPNIDTLIVCTFNTAEFSKVANTKVGAVVRFKGKIKINTDLIDIVAVDDCKFEPDK